MNLQIDKYYYHKTIKENGYDKVVLQEQLVGYFVSINKHFWECESEDEVKLKLIEELKILRKQLETELNERYSLRRVR